MKKIIKIVSDIAGRIDEDRVTVYAAQASFYVIIASIPFIMLLLSLARYITPLSYNEIITAVNAIVPQSLQGFADSIIAELFGKSASSVVSLTAVSAVWPAARGVEAVARGVRRVYHSPEPKNFVRGILGSLLRTVIFIGMLLLSLVVIVFGGSIISMIAGRHSALAELFVTMQKLSSMVMFVVFCSFFAFVYSSFSTRKIKAIRQLPGAIFTTAGWIIFSAIFSLYIENYSNYSYVYGSLAAIVLLMLWLYSCMIIFLLGAELNVIIENLRTKDERD